MTAVYFHQVQGLAYASLPVHKSGTDAFSKTLETIAEIKIPQGTLQPGDMVRIVATSDATNREGYNINWSLRTRIEPTPGNDWGDNIPPDRHDEEGNYAVNGFVGYNVGGNITDGEHHKSHPFVTQWIASEAVNNYLDWYVKLTARAVSSAAQSGDEYGLDYSQLEVQVIRGVEFQKGDPGELEYLDSAVDIFNKSVYEFDLPFGAEDPDRNIIIPIATRSPTAGRKIDRVTIAGVDASKLLSETNKASGSNIGAFYGAHVPQGLSGIVRVETSGDMHRMGASSYRKLGSLEPYGTWKTTVLGSVNNLYSLAPSLPDGAFLGMVFGRENYNWGARIPDYDSGNMEGGFGYGLVSFHDTSGPTTSVTVLQPDNLGSPGLLTMAW